MSVCKGSIRLSLLAASALGSLILSEAALAQADAPDAQAAPQIDSEQVNDIVVTGYRASLQNSTNAKRDATGFSDSIAAAPSAKT